MRVAGVKGAAEAWPCAKIADATTVAVEMGCRGAGGRAPGADCIGFTKAPSLPTRTAAPEGAPWPYCRPVAGGGDWGGADHSRKQTEHKQSYADSRAASKLGGMHTLPE